MPVGEILQSNLLQQAARPCLRGRVRKAAYLRLQHDVAECGAPIEQQVMLEHHPDIGQRPSDLAALDRYPAGIGVINPAMIISKVLLPAPAGAENRNELAPFERKRHLVEHQEAAWHHAITHTDAVDRHRDPVLARITIAGGHVQTAQTGDRPCYGATNALVSIGRASRYSVR